MFRLGTFVCQIFFKIQFYWIVNQIVNSYFFVLNKIIFQKFPFLVTIFYIRRLLLVTVVEKCFDVTIKYGICKAKSQFSMKSAETSGKT